MASSVPELLLNTLQSMKKGDLMSFRWYLINGVDGFKPIPRAQLEKLENMDVVDKMVQTYERGGAALVTLAILRKIDQNQLAEELREELKERNEERERCEKVNGTKPTASSTAAANGSLLIAPPTGGPREDTTNDNKKHMADSDKDRQGTEREDEQLRLQLISSLRQRYERVLIGNNQTGHNEYLDDVYTDLVIVPNESGGVINKHEVTELKTFSSASIGEESSVECNDIFKAQPGTDRRHRKVMTMGIAGVGKTISVSKFIYDWVKERDNQDVRFIFPLPFRELNLRKDKTFSLIELLNQFFFTSSPTLGSLPEDDGKVLFIFDGLDECRFPLCFEDGKELTDVNEKASVGSLVTNLVRKKLLPFALIWITCRPAAAHLIPRQHVDLVTEVRGFSDEQKEAYFGKFCSQDVAMKRKMISHLRKSRSLYIMCQIPVFCWISATVLQPLMARDSMKEVPATLTGMYTNFLLQQKNLMKMRSLERDEKAPAIDSIILKLGKLALHTLGGDLTFYEDDLRKCGIDVTDGVVFSGLCTQIFRQQERVSERNIFSFVHLSVQECMAALYVHYKFCNSRRNALEPKTICNMLKWRNKKIPDLHKYSVERALKSQNGHLDLFLRFFLGLSLKSNQSVLKELLPKLKVTVDSVKDTTDYIKEKLAECTECSTNGQTSSDRSMNLLHCLSELKDNSLTSQIQNYLNSGHLSSKTLSSTQWSVLVFVLLMSEELEEKFELKKYRPSDEGLRRLLPVMKNTRRALLDHCNLTKDSCQALASVFLSDTQLRELDLSNNDKLLDAGIDLLSSGLSSSHCKLEILRLPHCNLTMNSCEALASALQSENSPLKELDLSKNDLEDSGVKLLAVGLRGSHCKLEILRLSGCLITEEGCSYLAAALSSNPSHLRELDLTYNYPGDSGEKLLAAKQKDPHCKLEALRLEHAGKIRLKPGLRKYSCELTLVPNTAHARLCLSDRDRKVECAWEPRQCEAHLERFSYWEQVLCREALTGCCYWECEWSGWRAEIAMTYQGIGRQGASFDTRLGWNELSWCLDCSNDTYCACHNKKVTDLPGAASLSKRIGVYLDWPAGTLSFYSVSPVTHKLTHLHTFYARFTEPLYAGFRVSEESSVCLCPIG